MFENKQKIIIISLLIATIIIIIIFVLWLLLKPQEAPMNLIQKPTSTIQVGEKKVESVILESADTKRIQEEKQYPLGAKQIAMTFAERYASYSKDEPIKNIEDLQSLTTADFYSAILQAAEKRKKVDYFYGYSAKALATKLISYNQSEAIIEVSLQIEQIIETGDRGNVVYRTLKVNLIKINEEWKVKGASWR